MTQRDIDSNTKKSVDDKDGISNLWRENNQQMAFGTMRPLEKQIWSLSRIFFEMHSRHIKDTNIKNVIFKT